MPNVNIKDVARLARVSTTTVSRLLNDPERVRPVTRLQIEQAIEQLNYTPNALARGLKHEKTYVVGIVVSDISNPFFMGMCRAIEDILEQYNYNIVVCSTNENPQKERRYLKMLMERRVDGVFLSSTGSNNDAIQSLSDSGVSVLLVDRQLNQLAMDSVLEDNFAGGFRLTEYLIAKGHRRIAVIKGALCSTTSDRRYEGALEAMRRAGIEADDALVVSNCQNDDDSYRAMERLWRLEHRPTAVFTVNMRLFNGLIRYTNDRKIAIPEQLSVVSYGLEEFRNLYGIPITCIVQKPRAFGHKAAEIMLRKLKGKEPGGKINRYVFDQDLFEGASVRAVP